MSEPGMGVGGQGIPMTTSPQQYSSQQQQYGQQPQQYPPQQYQGQGQAGPMQGLQNVLQAPAQMMTGSTSKESPALAAMVLQPEEPNPTEGCNIFLAVFIPFCAFTSTILSGLAGSETIGQDSGWKLALSATVITAIGVVGLEIVKRMISNTTMDDAENSMGIAVLAHANIRAVAVRALAQTYWELKKSETILREIELFLVTFFAIAGAILSGAGAAFYDIRVLSIISAYLTAIAGSFVVCFEIVANGKRMACRQLEEQLRRNPLVSEFLRADASRKHSMLQDRVEALSQV